MTRPVSATGRINPASNPFPQQATQEASTVNKTGMPYIATRLKQTTANDGGGDSSTTYVANGTFPCRLTPVSQMARAMATQGGDRVHEAATHFVTCAREQAIETKDRLEVEGTEYAILVITSYGMEESAKRLEVRAI